MIFRFYNPPLNYFLFFIFLMFPLICSGQYDQPEKETRPSFTEVETPPLARRCKEKWDVERQRNCTSKYIQRYFLRKFDTDLASNLGLPMVHLEVEFVIDEHGKVTNVRSYGLHETLREHLTAVTKTLPDFRPAVHEGKPTSTKLGMVLTFKVPD